MFASFRLGGIAETMNFLLRFPVLLSLLLTAPAIAFTDTHRPKQASLVTRTTAMSSTSSSEDSPPAPTHHPFCDLPGDPSLMLTTNVDLGAKKMDVMKGKLDISQESCGGNHATLTRKPILHSSGISASIAKHTGKPESCKYNNPMD